MSAYSFQERFIPFLLDGSKDHTVRKKRIGRSRHARPGETLQLYYGMRTKYCTKIGEATCRTVSRILIIPEFIFIVPADPFDETTFDEGDGALLPEEADRFAWKDGFRPQDSTIDKPEGAFELMFRFWRQFHELPFEGVVIYWTDFKPAK